MSAVTYDVVPTELENGLTVTEEPAAPADTRAPSVVINSRLNPYGVNKLGMEVTCTSNMPVKYSYVVEGKTADTNFTYSCDDYATRFVIPVIGLYPGDTRVVYTFEAVDGSTSVRPFQYGIPTSSFNDVVTHLDWEIKDRTIAAQTLDQGWMMTTRGNAYDKNGDMRMCVGHYLNWDNTPLREYKMYDRPDKSYFIRGDVTVGKYNYWAQRIYGCNAIGKIYKAFVLPQGHGVHHDVTWDRSGYYMYALTTTVGEPSATQLHEAHIAKINTVSNTITWVRDYSQYFYNTKVLTNSEEYDAHLNCLDLDPDRGLFVTDSRSTSTMFGIRESDGAIVWTIDDPRYPMINPTTNLRVVNPDSFEYPCGEHTTIYTNNPKYSSYIGTNKFVIITYDNASCLNEDDTRNLKPISEPFEAGYYAKPVNSNCKVYAVDLDAMTVRMLDKFDFNARSEFKGGVELDGNYYDVFHPDGYAFYTFDANGKIGLEAHNFEPQGYTAYRARIYKYDELRALLW